MSDSVLQSLLALERAGGCVLFAVTTPAGGTQAVATPEQAAAITAGEAHVSSLLGLSTAEYQQWLDQDGFVQCSASTNRGARCRNNVSGSAVTDGAEWKALNDSRPYCQVHGGE